MLLVPLGRSHRSLDRLGFLGDRVKVICDVWREPQGRVSFRRPTGYWPASWALGWLGVLRHRDLAVGLIDGSNRSEIDDLQVLLWLSLGDLDLHDLECCKAVTGVLGRLIPGFEALQAIDKIGDRVAGKCHAVHRDARHKSLLKKVFDLVVA